MPSGDNVLVHVIRLIQMENVERRTGAKFEGKYTLVVVKQELTGLTSDFELLGTLQPISQCNDLVTIKVRVRGVGHDWCSVRVGFGLDEEYSLHNPDSIPNPQITLYNMYMGLARLQSHRSVV